MATYNILSETSAGNKKFLEVEFTSGETVVQQHVELEPNECLDVNDQEEMVESNEKVALYLLKFAEEWEHNNL
jgi:hypothetical protein